MSTLADESNERRGKGNLVSIESSINASLTHPITALKHQMQCVEIVRRDEEDGPETNERKREKDRERQSEQMENNKTKNQTME